jgi:hypothetical protein
MVTWRWPAWRRRGATSGSATRKRM